MTPQEGQKKLKKLLGPKAMWRVYEKAPSAEVRADARARLRTEQDAKAAVFEARDARANWLLKNDAEYQRLKEDARVKLAAVKETSSILSTYRVTVGTNEGFAFMVEAQGDNWADVIRKIEDKRAAEAAKRRVNAGTDA